MLLIMSQLLLLPTKQPRYCRQPGQRIKTKHKTESSSSGRFFSPPSMAKRTLSPVQTPTSRIVHYVDFYLVICSWPWILPSSRRLVAFQLPGGSK